MENPIIIKSQNRKKTKMKLALLLGLFGLAACADNDIEGPGNMVHHGKFNHIKGRLNSLDGFRNNIKGNRNEVKGSRNIVSGDDNLVFGTGNAVFTSDDVTMTPEN